MSKSASKEVFQITYKVQGRFLSHDVTFETPLISKAQAIEFITAIGPNRVVQILENDKVLNSEQVFAFLREAETFGGFLPAEKQKSQSNRPRK